MLFFAILDEPRLCSFSQTTRPSPTFWKSRSITKRTNSGLSEVNVAIKGKKVNTYYVFTLRIPYSQTTYKIAGCHCNSGKAPFDGFSLSYWSSHLPWGSWFTSWGSSTHLSSYSSSIALSGNRFKVIQIKIRIKLQVNDETNFSSAERARQRN